MPKLTKSADNLSVRRWIDSHRQEYIEDSHKFLRAMAIGAQMTDWLRNNADILMDANKEKSNA